MPNVVKKKTLEKSGLEPCGTNSPSRSEALCFVDSAKSPSTKIDGSLVNFRRRLSNQHGSPRRLLTWTFEGTSIRLWARLRDSHKSGPQSWWWKLAWSLAQRNERKWEGLAWIPHIVHEKSISRQMPSTQLNHQWTFHFCKWVFGWVDKAQCFRSARRFGAVWFEPRLFQGFFFRTFGFWVFFENTFWWL